MSLRVILELHLKEGKVLEEEGGVVKGVVGGLPLLPFPGVKEKCFFFSRWMPGESERRGEWVLWSSGKKKILSKVLGIEWFTCWLPACISS